MMLIRFLLLLLLVVLVVLGTHSLTTPTPSPQEHVANKDWPDVLAYARQNLPKEGVLERKPDGFVYLKVDDAYIHTLLPMLGIKNEGYREPPFFRAKDSPGAHISVFYAEDHIIPEELGQTFHFQLKNFKIVYPSRAESFVILQVKSPALEQLRRK